MLISFPYHWTTTTIRNNPKKLLISTYNDLLFFITDTSKKSFLEIFLNVNFWLKLRIAQNLTLLGDIHIRGPGSSLTVRHVAYSKPGLSKRKTLDNNMSKTPLYCGVQQF